MELRDKNGLTEQEFLAAYRPKDYERPSLTADVAVFTQDGERTRLLLVRRGNHPCLGKWALPGGFAEKQETIEGTAMRELEEETSLTGVCLTPVGLFSTPGRDPRTWIVSQAFASIIPESRIAEIKAGDDAAAADWFDIGVERSGRKVKLHFKGQENEFDVCLRFSEEGGFAENGIEVLSSGGLAFDHPAIIGRAMEIMRLI